MFEDLINALRNFKSNKTRTILSLLGIIIGVASVIMVTTIGSSASADIRRSLGSSGLDLVQVYPGWGRNRNAQIEFNENFRREIERSVGRIRRLVYNNEFSGRLRNGALELDISLRAVEQDYFPMMDLKLDYGRFFLVSEEVMAVQKIVLGSETARYLFPEGDAGGKLLLLRTGDYQMGFEVAGVLEATESTGFENPNQSAFVPRTVYTRKISPSDTKASGILIQAMDRNDTAKIQREVEALGSEISSGNSQALYVFSMQSLLDQYNQVTGTINLLLSGIAGISLLVGGIGIMNIMIVTVTERKREIGIRKALGASPAAIRTQFLVESATITLLGGITGIILGILLSALVVSSFNWALELDWRNCLAAFAFSAVVGIFFGLHPAIRAARLDPVDALAGE